MPRTIYLIIYNSPLFPAHWSLWLPSLSIPFIGKRLHASGDAATGFDIAFERNYDIDADTRRHQLLPLAQVADHYVVDVNGDGSQTNDQIARDALEEIALSVPAPGRSLVSASLGGPRQRVQIHNCQTWIREVVVKLVQNGVMEQEALDIVDSAPKN